MFDLGVVFKNFLQIRSYKKEEEEFFYTVKHKRVKFENEAKAQHCQLVAGIRYYLKDPGLMI